MGNTMTQYQLCELARRKIADNDQAFMDLVTCKENPLTKKDLIRNIERRPSLWKKYESWVNVLQ